MPDASHLAFIVPIRHPANSRDWDVEKSNLSRTARSIAGQKIPGWCAVVVANVEADLPPLPEGFEVVRVSHAPNSAHDILRQDRAAAWAAIRRDKGRRVADGMRAAAGSRYFMVVDGDDLISNRISGHVLSHMGEPGWRFERGWTMDRRGRYVLAPPYRFDKTCGTSHVVRADLFALPEPDQDGYWDRVDRMLGSHVSISETLEAEGAPIATLPFPGATYIVGHANSHSLSRGPLRQYVLNRGSLRDRKTALRSLRSFRLVDRSFRREFLGE